MLTLGLAGGLDPVHEEFLDTPENYTYDGAAVLVEDGKVVVAVEEERLNRIKRSNKFPLQAIRCCLEQRGASIQDVNRIAYYVNEEAANILLSRLYLAKPEIGRVNARTMLGITLGRHLGAKIDPGKLHFFQHKLMHAVGVMDQSGFDESLVLVIDNAGGVYRSRREQDNSVSFDSLVALSPAKSLGRFWEAVLPFLGLGMFDEFKAMMMSPFGDPEIYASVLGNLYSLLPDGDYVLHLERIGLLLDSIEPRRKGQEPTQAHKDLAASLQQSMEKIVLHVLRHFRQLTGLKNLCIAGGMAENSTTNGKVLQSGLFDQVFVHPAAYDSGCALGAALLASYEQPVTRKNGQVHNVYWGPDIGSEAQIAAELEKWHGFLSFEKATDVEQIAAEALSNGAVVAWAQGRSEFGSHALGNRNVFADPRDSASIERVKKALGHQEYCWPFAPAVLEEDAADYFELPAGVESFRFKTFVTKVRENHRSLLPATTHVDGTARLQTVSRETNPRLWQLISAFKDRTGVPVLLNTSLNNSAEPMVASTADAIVAFITTGVDLLVIGDFIVRKLTPTADDFLSLHISLPPYVRVFRSKGLAERQKQRFCDEIRTSYAPQVSRPISPQIAELLLSLNGGKPLGDLLRDSQSMNGDAQALLAEFRELWSDRLVMMRASAREMSR
ncbi:MAG: nodulation protein [Acidobacteriia bacterium]|nr:nodulation protein [Terriglobia bacterium]